MNVSDDDTFYVNIDIRSHTRIISERQYYKDQYLLVMREAETAAEEWRKHCKDITLKYEALRDRLHDHLRIERGTLSDDELFRQVVSTYWVQAGPVTVHHKPPTPEDEAARDRLLTLADQSFSIAAQGAAEQQQHAEQLAEWLDAMPPPVPGEIVSLPITGQIDPTAESVDNGPATETMQPVVNPPELPEPYVLGFRMERGHQLPDEPVEIWTDRLGNLWILDPGHPGAAPMYHNRATDTWRTLVDLLHMHGVLWQVRDMRDDNGDTEQADAQNGGDHD
jgi:hypothetical protein